MKTLKNRFHVYKIKQNNFLRKAAATIRNQIEETLSTMESHSKGRISYQLVQLQQNNSSFVYEVTEGGKTSRYKVPLIVNEAGVLLIDFHNQKKVDLEANFNNYSKGENKMREIKPLLPAFVEQPTVNAVNTNEEQKVVDEAEKIRTFQAEADRMNILLPSEYNASPYFIGGGSKQTGGRSGTIEPLIPPIV